MVELIVSALIWTLVIILVVFRRARKERSILAAATSIAVAMLLNDDDLYFIVDGWFGGRDIVHMLSAVLLMVGVYYLARGISRTGNKYLTGTTPKIILAVAIVVTVLSFFLVPHMGETTDSFMRVYGEHLSAVVYSSTQYVYLLYVFSALSVTAINILRNARVAREKVAAVFMLLGCLSTLALSVNSIGMWVTGWLGGLEAAEPWRPTYYIFQALLFLFMLVGLGIAPIARWVGQSRRERALERELDRLEDLWRDAIEARPNPELEGGQSDAEHRLHRRIIEIRDAAMDGRNEFTLTEEDRALLRDAEERLMATSR
jgi:hypothetical protein